MSWVIIKDKIYDEIIYYIENSVVNNNEFIDNYDNELFDEKVYKIGEFDSYNNLNNYVS